MHEVLRTLNRRHDQLRTIKISYNVFGYAPGSVLFELGNTKVLCSVSIQPGVPLFLKGSKTGWLTAEYAMLPTSGHTRSFRESTQVKRNDRSVEISRLIGRSLRSIVNLTKLHERTIFVDCDVLQADGSTRTASITGAYIALKMAVDQWLKTGELSDTILTDALTAVSVGFKQGKALLDLDYAEDNTIDADYNFVLTQSQKIIEIQGCAEKNMLSWDDFDKLKVLAIKGNNELFDTVNQSLQMMVTQGKEKKSSDTPLPLFSLKNRLVDVV